MTTERAKHAKTAARQQFDNWADSYDRFFLRGLFFEPAYRALLEEIFRWRGADSAPFSVLDIGCGTGTLAFLLAGSSLPVDVIGLDYTPSMVQRAKHKSEQNGLRDRCRFVCGDAEHLAFDDGRFDLVTCCHSFHHYPHQQAAVTEMRRVLRPGGRLMLLDGFRDNVIGWFLFDVCITRAEGDVHHVPWSSLREMFEHAGLHDVRHRKISLWAPLLLMTGSS